jgi:hypothetical protein
VTGNGGGSRRHVNANPEDVPERKIDRLYVLVAIHPGGGEGVFGQVVPGMGMTNFAFGEKRVKDKADDLLRSQGTYEAAERDGITLEWRTYMRQEDV